MRAHPLVWLWAWVVVEGLAPVPRAQDFSLVNNKNREKLLKLTSLIEVADADEINAVVPVPTLEGPISLPVSHTTDVRQGLSQPSNAGADGFMSTRVPNDVVPNPPPYVKEDRNGVPVFPPFLAANLTMGNATATNLLRNLQAYKVKKVELLLRGFFHEHAEDVTMELIHEGVTATLVDGRGDSKTYGRPRPREASAAADPRGNQRAHDPPAYARTSEHAGRPLPRLEGDGYNYMFKDLEDTNLALNRPATQSTTLYGGNASKAVDGDTNGFYSGDSVTHTAGRAGDTQEFETLDKLAPDLEPWWQVDLGAAKTIGTIRVWNRQQEPNVDEIQIVTIAGPHLRSQLGGFFQLRFRTTTTLYTTANIAHDAVAMASEENTASTALGVAPGESVQSKLQALPNVGTVMITRTPYLLNDLKGWSWAVTFVSEPGNLLPLEPIYTGLTGQLIAGGGKVADAGYVFVTTPQEGNGNTWYNYKNMPVMKQDTLRNVYNTPNEPFVITGRMVPCWVMIMPTDIGDGNLTMAKSKAVWKQRVTEDVRETILSLEQTSLVSYTGRYVRIQLEEPDPLSIAEVQVYQSTSNLLRDYIGGSPIVGGTYQAETTMNELFQGMTASGPWVLRVVDKTKEGLQRDHESLPYVMRNGVGAFDDWQLAITDMNNTKRFYNMDLSVEVKTLPRYGTLYRYVCALGTCGAKGYRGEEFTHVPGMQRHLSECYGSCDSNYGVGNLLSTDTRGSIARDNLLALDRQVIYRPAVDFLGTDSFEFSVFLGTQESSNLGKATIHTRRCRSKIDCENEYFGDDPRYEQQRYK